MKQRGTNMQRSGVSPPSAPNNVEEIVESDSPIAMSSFLATRGEARGLSTKAQVELQEQIAQASKKLQEKWAALEKKWRSLEKERKDNASSYGITGGGGPIVELNVGGVDMDVLRADLVRAEESVLALVFGGRWEGRMPRDSRGRVFVDVSPSVFRKIVGFLVKLGIAKPGKVLELPTLTPEEQPTFDHLVLVLGLWPHVYEGRAAEAPVPSPRVKPKDIPAPAVEPADARRFGRSVATSFAVEEVALEMADAEFQAAKKRYDCEVASVAEFAGAPAGFGREGIDDDIVELNIGGSVIATRRSTLCRCPDSVLSRMFDHSNEKRAPPFVKDTKGRYFVQYNDYCFAKIIEVLRMKRWPWPPTECNFAASIEGLSASRFRIFVREDEREDFGSLTAYFFPGSESEILEAVGRAGGGIAARPAAAAKAVSVRPPAPAPAPAITDSPEPAGHSKRSSRSRIDPRKLPSEISVLEIRVGLVRKVTSLPRHRGQAMMSVQIEPDDKDHTEDRTVLWHFDAPPPRANSRIIVLCNSPSVKHQGILFTAVVLCMDDDLLVPPRNAPVGELVTVKGHPPMPSKNPSAVRVIWDKVINEELFQVGEDEVVRFEHRKLPGPLMTSEGPIMCTGYG